VGQALEIRLLGELEVVRGGRPVPLPASKRSRALAAYLIVSGRPHLRESLCQLFWDGPDNPRAALRWSLNKIRPVFDDAATRMVADRERVGFEPHGATVDLLEIRSQLGARAADAPIDRLRSCAGRFRGEFLEGLDLPECFAYHEWCMNEREAARTLRISILQALTSATEPGEALRFARERLAIDPLAESAHADVVRLLGALGRAREALKQYETSRRILQTELGVRSAPELERSRMGLGQVTVTPSAPPAPTQPIAEPAPPCAPLVGRARETAIVQALIAAATEGRAREALLVVGEPGMGKSRLLEEMQRLVRGKDGIVLAGRAFEAEMVRPYGAWIDALRSIRLDRIDAGLRADLAPLLPELGAPPGAAGDRNRLFDAVAQLLRTLAAEHVVALVLDDVQWFDEASAALLHYVARAVSGSRIVVACGARSGELFDNPAALRLVRALSRDARLRELPLAPLDEGDIAELVKSIGSDLDVARVFAESGGQPLFAIEISRALEQGNAALSGTLEGLIADRLARLDERTRDLLPWAAALGRGFTPEVLARTTSLPAAELLNAVDELERHGVLRVARSHDDAAYDFAHDLVREAAYRQLSSPRRRLVHLQIARALSAMPDSDGALAGEVAHHASLGGDAELAVGACLSAGDRCLRMFALSEALELANRGNQLIDRLPQETRLRRQMDLLRLKVHAGADCEGELGRVIQQGQQAGLYDEVAKGYNLRAVLHHGRGDFGGAHSDSLHAEGAARIAGDPATAARQIANSGFCLSLIERDMARAKAMLDEAGALASRAGLDIADLEIGMGLVRHYDGNPDAAMTLLERGLAIARREHDHWRECLVLVKLAQIELERGRSEEALRRCQELEPVAAKMGNGSEVAAAATLTALARLVRGDADARPHIEAALTCLRDLDAKALLAYALLFLGQLDLAAGRVDAARESATEALAAAQVVGRLTEMALARAVLARVALATGNVDEARSIIAESIDNISATHRISAVAREAVLQVAQALGLA
jgi:DNA-binding SARP family transcriptional activator/tetratricopeptide (TPR) repeat protein